MLKLVEFLHEHVVVVVSRQQVETVDAESFNVLTVLGQHLCNALHGCVPLSVLDVDLALLNMDR